MYTIIAKIDDLRKIVSPGDNLCPYYLIDRDGRVFSEFSGLELKQVITENGYKAVSMNTIDGKRIQRRIHRLVMFTFAYQIGCENLEVNHKDGNKFNNNISNLEWTTPKENIRHAIKNNLREAWSGDNNPCAKISDTDAIVICNMVIQGYSNEEIIDIVPNSNDSIITNIILGNTWKGIINQNLVNKMRETRYPCILTIIQKHQLCKYYQDFKCIKSYKGSIKDYINNALYNLNIIQTDSTFRMAKRLFYKYQDPEITSLYNY